MPEREVRSGSHGSPIQETGLERVSTPIPQKPSVTIVKPIESVSNQAYFYVLTNDNMMTMLFALEASFKNVSSTRRRIALCTPGVTSKARDTMKKLDIEIRDISQPQHPNFATEISRWKDTLSKFAILQMTDIEKFVYIDLDFIILANMDYLFDLPTKGLIYGMTDGEQCNKGPYNMNAGLLVGNPNQTLYTELFKLLDGPDVRTITRKGDQSMLNTYMHQQYAKNPVASSRPHRFPNKTTSTDQSMAISL